jgi:hypothetical protein
MTSDIIGLDKNRASLGVISMVIIIGATTLKAFGR